jgi:hypothetical protein
MEEKFDFIEVARRCDKNAFMIYYDEALTNRNFVIKLRTLIDDNLPLNVFEEKVKSLNEALKVQQHENYLKHFPSYRETKGPIH